ncbi:anthranilate 1,2-dioxygenase [Rugosibacter aromaticivorans]|uniref:Anthranilate 1,2-dioxygenase n=2 Tax=Rugosibacter aromaticivorans TaxID=1565605 RepID=A0A0C5J2X9_9PROT|nr:anthranilate 1,2-dioxygenase [Rugosibacter aromaticivorans]TBR14735.1 MAG: anthranilate 1,2-dioxygenase [Rugosibacter sp.]
MEVQWRVERLHSRYAACIDDDALESWPEFFTLDACRYEIIPRENVERGLPLALMFCTSRGMLVDRIVSLREANIYPQRWYRHIISNVLIQSVDADGLQVQSNYVVLQTRRTGQTEIFSAGKYVDRIVLHKGELKFAEKRVVVDTHRVDTLLVAPI